MRDLSMHVLDIVQNSIKANATLITVSFTRDENDIFTFTVEDDGCGMSPEFLAKVTDPFTTTRTTRKVGLGIPMLKQSSEMAGGTFSLQSELGKGTIISASFDLKNIDCIPMGEMCDSLLTLVILNPDRPEFVFKASSPTMEAFFDTRMVREAVGGISLNESDISAWMKESIDEEFKPILEV
ncbi:MAG: sensor histidine kinase [Clostridiales bacterium]|nr:sensor histidine kinase [Clostridiales bacterium]